MVTIVLILSDIHSQRITLENILQRAEEIITQSFIVLIAGDITNFDTIENMASLLELVSEYSSKIYFVFGNCDPYYDADKLRTKSIHIESNPQSYEGITFVGFGSASPQVNHKVLRKLKKREEKVCLLTHVPPYGTNADTVSLNKHVGSKEVRKLLETYSNIFLSVSGHIHESPTISSLGDCFTINPGSVTRGYFAIIEIDEDYKIQGNIYNIHEL
ncbi:MAG: metallophosphoesterase family protein [Candidatus Heimdallarchaeota archaeon]|nr:metallophosphoesterase family protein [Candidatus Heimdallarchaeota archaeon]